MLIKSQNFDPADWSTCCACNGGMGLLPSTTEHCLLNTVMCGPQTKMRRRKKSDKEVENKNCTADTVQ